MTGDDLPDDVAKWLKGLRKDDIEDIKGAIKLKRRLEAGGWLFKWIAITVVSFFIGAAALGDTVMKIV